MTSAWTALWTARQPPACAADASVIDRLTAAGGLDSGFAHVTADAWLAFVNETAATLGVAAGESVFDVGCGAGAFLQPFHAAGHPVGGLDCSPALIALARETHPGGDFRVGNAAELDAGTPVDVVVSMGVFLYFESEEYAERVLDAMVAKARRAVAILDVPDRATHAAAIAERERVAGGAAAYAARYAGLDHRYYDRAWFAEALRARGLSGVETADQSITGYGNAPYRFNAWGFKG